MAYNYRYINAWAFSLHYEIIIRWLKKKITTYLLDRHWWFGMVNFDNAKLTFNYHITQLFFKTNNDHHINTMLSINHLMRFHFKIKFHVTCKPLCLSSLYCWLDETSIIKLLFHCVKILQYCYPPVSNISKH